MKNIKFLLEHKRWSVQGHFFTYLIVPLNYLMSALVYLFRVNKKIQKKSKHRIVVHSIIRWGERYIDEWLAYHKLIGVDHFYLYDNDPELPLSKILGKHANYITIIPFTIPHSQKLAQKHYLKNYSDQSEWTAFIDIDEFISLKTGNLGKLIEDNESFDTIYMGWVWYGSNGHKVPVNQFCISAFSRRGGWYDKQCKYIAKNDRILLPGGIHEPYLKVGSTTINGWMHLGKNVEKSMLDAERPQISLNHYHMKSESEWFKRATRPTIAHPKYNHELERNKDLWNQLKVTSEIPCKELQPFVHQIIEYLTVLYEFPEGLSEVELYELLLQKNANSLSHEDGKEK